MGTVAGAFAASSMMDPLFAAELEERVKSISHLDPKQVASDEDFWGWVQQAYTVSPNIINLNNGGVSPQPRSVQEAMIRYYEYANEVPSMTMWRHLDQGRTSVRRDLAALAGCDPEEVAINRNTTEALATIVFGLNLKKGDEVVLTKQDYPNMINAWKQREDRDGIVLKWLNLEMPLEDEEATVKMFTDAFTKKTKVVHVTHMINWTGQILPAKRIAEEAHKRDIEVVLDGAHTFAHIDYNLHDIGCDYFGTSLHKWLCAPFGSGFMYVKKEKIKDLWPMFPGPEPDSNDITKFEHLGTRNFPIEQAIGSAIRFHKVIGMERKEARLRYLKNYWGEKAAKMTGARFYTSLKPEFSCALATIGFEGIDSSKVGTRLWREHKIHTTTVKWENIDGVRITPNVYTRIDDLDILVNALTDISTTPSD